jgi:hypothetical protein
MTLPAFATFLVPLYPDRTDINGNAYSPQTRVVAKSFEKSNSLLQGIVGVKYGLTQSPTLAPRDAKEFALVKAKCSENRDMIEVDGSRKLFKFREGQVIFVGDIAACAVEMKQLEPSTETSRVAGCFESSDAPGQHRDGPRLSRSGEDAGVERPRDLDGLQRPSLGAGRRGARAEPRGSGTGRNLSELLRGDYNG